MVGGKGNDLLLPGQGSADAMDGGGGIDTVSYANFVPSGSMGVIILLDPDATLTDLDAVGDDFANVERFVGTSVSDRFEFYRHDVSRGYFVKGGGGDDHLHVEGGVMRGGRASTRSLAIPRTSLSTHFGLSSATGVMKLLGSRTARTLSLSPEKNSELERC